MVSSKKVVILSINGLRPEFYLDSRFEAPTLRRLAAKGAKAASMTPIYPPLTYPCHTTLVTGVRPAAHGITSNCIFSRTSGPTAEWYWDARYIRMPTLWQDAKRAGLSTAAIRWPVTVGAEIDWLIPEVFSVTESSVEADIELTARNSTPLLLQEIFGSLDLPGRSNEKTLKTFKVHDRWVSTASIHILRKYRPDLTFIHLIQADKAQHDEGRESLQLVEAVREIDSLVQGILDSIDLTETTLIILGDHGFEDYGKTVNVNALFAERGWLTFGKDGTIDNWKVIAHVDGGQGAVYLKDKRLEKEVLEVLRSNEASRYRILGQRALKEFGAFPEALCALAPEPNVALSDRLNDPLIHSLERIQGHHGGLPAQPNLKTGCILVGAGIHAGYDLGAMSLLDVAPTVAKLLKIDRRKAA